MDTDTGIGTLSLSQQLEDCTVGESKEITLRVTPTKNDDSGFEATIDEVSGYEETPKEDASENGEEAPAKMPMKGMAPAVAVVIAGKKGK